MSTNLTERASRIRSSVLDRFVQEIGLSDDQKRLAQDYFRGLGANFAFGTELAQLSRAEVEMREKVSTGAWSMPHLTVEKIDEGTFGLVGWGAGHILEERWEGAKESLLAELPSITSSLGYAIEESEREKLL